MKNWCSVSIGVTAKGRMYIEREHPPMQFIEEFLGTGDPALEVVEYMNQRCEELAKDLEERYGVIEVDTEGEG